MSSDNIVYVLNRLNWARTDYPYAGTLTRLPGSTRLESFEDYEKAEQTRIEMENQARGKFNPFLCGGPALHFQTSFDADRLHDWLLDSGVEPPSVGKKGSRDWKKWWEQTGSRLDEWQTAKVWEALDRVRFYEVVQRPARPVVYVVTEIHWEYNDEGYDPDVEGGRALLAFTSREKAERHRQELEKQRRQAYGNAFYGYDMTGRIHWKNPFEEVSDTSVWGNDLPDDFPLFYEVVEVELEEVSQEYPS